MRRRFVTLDVFTTQKLAGNPLAVVLDSEGLDSAQMQAIAGEFNLSETVFVLPAIQPMQRASLRIFTPGRELPFAGHPTIGTAVLLALEDRLKAGDVFVLHETIGDISCSVVALDQSRGNEQGSARFQLPRLPQEVAKPASDANLAAALSLDIAQIGFDMHRPTVTSAGVAFTFVPLRNMAAVAAAKVDLRHWGQISQAAGRANVYIYSRETSKAGHAFHARMFAPGMSLAEDPATGGAAAAFAGVVMAFDKPSDGAHVMIIEQGYEMGRPSQIELTLHVDGGALKQAFIGGSAIILTEGVLHL